MNKEVDDNGSNPFGRDYNKQVIYHRNSSTQFDLATTKKPNEASTSQKAYQASQVNEGSNWNNYFQANVVEVVKTNVEKNENGIMGTEEAVTYVDQRNNCLWG